MEEWLRRAGVTGRIPQKEGAESVPHRLAPVELQQVMRERIVEGDDTLIEFGLNPVVKPMKGPLMTPRRRRPLEVSPSSSCWW